MISKNEDLFEIKINKWEVYEIISEWGLVNVDNVINNYDDELSILDLFELFDLIVDKSQFWIDDSVKSDELLLLFDNVLNTFGFYK